MSRIIKIATNFSNKSKARWYFWRQKLLEASDFSLISFAWQETSKEVIYSILLASFTISVLSLVFPFVLLQVYDRIIPNQSITTLVWLGSAVFVSLILSAILKIVRTYIGAWADAKYDHNVGCRAFKKILNCELSPYEESGSGEHLKRITAINMLRQFYAGQTLTSLIDIPFIAIFLLLVAYIGGSVVLIPLVIIIMACVATFSNTSMLQSLLQERQDQDNRRMNFMVEMLSKINTIKANTMEAQMLRRFERLQKTSTLYDYKMSKRGSYLLSDNVIFSQLTVVLTVAYGGALVFTGSFSVGALAACTLLAGQCMQPINMVMNMWSRLQTIKIAQSELNKIFVMPEEYSSQLKQSETISGQIEFEKVSFNYDDHIILQDMDLKIMPRTTISITGPQLSGKSTILFLLMKLIAPSTGRILIDGQDMTFLDPENLRQHIGYMPDKAFLFQGTLLENLTMFNPLYDEYAKELSEKTGLAKFIEYFPEGYDTKLGAQAIDTLPRGIQQYVVIVRALVRQPAIILFDEADMTIDIAGDEKIRLLLEELRATRTIILVSHRPSILKLAQVNYHLEQGKLSKVT